MRVEISETRFFAQVSDLVSVTKVIALGGAAEQAQVSWSSTSRKPDSAGAMEFANQVETAAMLAGALDRAIKSAADLRWATVARSGETDKVRIIHSQPGQVLFIIPADWVIYAHGYEIQEVS